MDTASDSKPPGDNRTYVEDGGEIDDSDEYEDDELPTLASMTKEELRDLQKKIKVQKELNKRTDFAEVEGQPRCCVDPKTAKR